MKTKLVLAASVMALLFAAGAGHAKQKLGPPVKLVLSPASRVPAADIMKNLEDKCPNVTLTLNSKESDYMLDARWYPQEYRFMLLSKPHGDAVYATRTVLLSNAVKDVCKYINDNPLPPPPAK